MNWFRSIFLFLLVFVVITLFIPFESNALELESKYASITYPDQNVLRKMNRELYMGRLRSRVRTSGDTIEAEVAAKIDVIVEKVMTVLDMFPYKLRFSIVVHPKVKGVQKDFRTIYNVDVSYIAFYSPSKNRVFYSANNANLKVVAHEIAHVVVEKYFKISPPQKIHEVMAQFAAQHITD